jgi:hypothetical protein
MADEWTDAEKEAVIDLRQKGLSMAEIARLMRGRSRNAVIGQLDRLGMTRRQSKRRVKPEPVAPTFAPPSPPRQFSWEQTT